MLVIRKTLRNARNDVLVVCDTPKDVWAVERSDEGLLEMRKSQSLPEKTDPGAYLLEGTRKLAITETRRPERITITQDEVRTEILRSAKEAGEAETRQSATEGMTLNATQGERSRGRQEKQGRTATHNGIFDSAPGHSSFILAAV